MTIILCILCLPVIIASIYVIILEIKELSGGTYTNVSRPQVLSLTPAETKKLRASRHNQYKKALIKEFLT